jgi:mannose-6-phosphate isomerase
MAMDPLNLPSNQPADRFYRGGHRIAQFRGDPDGGDRVPEDWVGSTSTVFGHERLGLTTLPGGRTLIDEIALEPVGWLGQDHLDRFGVDTKLLVKLLDAGQRLPVHAHPGTSFAHDRLGRAHGKAEAWFILSEGDVYLGLVRDLSAGELAELVSTQDIDALLGLLHRRRVQPGDTVYVPPGMLHAIGAGVFLAEIQEPEDLSILLEWRGFELDGERDGHLGLGFETALLAVDLTARPAEAISALIGSQRHGESLLPAASREFFSLGRLRVEGAAELRAGFAVLIAIAGELIIRWDGGELPVRHGQTVVVPFAAGPLEVLGTGELLEFRPPSAGIA